MNTSAWNEMFELEEEAQSVLVGKKGNTLLPSRRFTLPAPIAHACDVAHLFLFQARDEDFLISAISNPNQLVYKQD